MLNRGDGEKRVERLKGLVEFIYDNTRSLTIIDICVSFLRSRSDDHYYFHVDH